jgi:hypothetical protein
LIKNIKEEKKISSKTKGWFWKIIISFKKRWKWLSEIEQFNLIKQFF